MIQNILIYGGIAINIVGALPLAYFAIGRMNDYRRAKNMPQKIDESRAKWASRRMIAFGLMAVGVLLVGLAAVISP